MISILKWWPENNQVVPAHFCPHPHRKVIFTRVMRTAMGPP